MENQLSTDDENGVNLLNRSEFSEGTVEDTLIGMQIEEDLRALVTELPESQRQVVDMRFYQNLSFKEIAALTGVSINTALGRMRYAILNLRRMARERSVSLIK